MRVGAEAGASRRPSTSLALAGGGGGGWKAAPPPVDAEVCAIALGAARKTQASASSSAAKGNLLKKVEGILFRTPTGLADGLALKELARLPKRKVRPSGRGHLGSPVPRYRGLGVAVKLSDVSAGVAAPLMRSHTSSARGRPLLLVRAGRPSPRSTRRSDHAISATSPSAIASTPRVKLAFAGTSGAGIASSFGMYSGIEISESPCWIRIVDFQPGYTGIG